MKRIGQPLLFALATWAAATAWAQPPFAAVTLPPNAVARPLPAPAVPAMPAVAPIAAPRLAIPAAIDPQQTELARLNAETRQLAGQISAKLQGVRSAQQGQWRGPRTCQGALVVWARPAEAEGGDFPRTAYDCSPYLCEAPGLCMAQCNGPGQCAPGAQCAKTASGGVCVPAR